MAKIKTRSAGKNRYKHKPKGVSAQAFDKAHWPYLPLLLVSAVLLNLGIQSGALQSAMRHPNSKVLAYATNMGINGLLADTNTARVSRGVSSLHLNSKLDAAAQAKANDMAHRNYWSHYTPSGNPPWVFVSSAGYSYLKLGENLAAGFSSEQATINGWLASPPHRENLLDPAFSDVGFGFANNSNYTSAGGGPMTVVVAFYGKPAGTPAKRVVAAAPTRPSTPSSAVPAAPAAKPKAKPAAKTPVAAASPKNPVEPKKAATTETPKSGITLSLRTSGAQVAFAKFPLSSFASGLALFGLMATLLLWLNRHLLAIRRAWAFSEAYVYKHPLMDVGLLVITALFFLLTKTAGYIQ